MSIIPLIRDIPTTIKMITTARMSIRMTPTFRNRAKDHREKALKLENRQVRDLEREEQRTCQIVEVREY